MQRLYYTQGQLWWQQLLDLAGPTAWQLLTPAQQVCRIPVRLEYLFYAEKDNKVVRLSNRADKQHFGAP